MLLMVDIERFINRVPFDPRRLVPGYSEQWVTIYPLSEVESNFTLNLIETTRPQGVVFHGRGQDLVRTIDGFTTRYKRRFGNDLQYAVAIAGDWDSSSIPGYIDYWIPALQLARSLGHKFGQPNREAAWKARAKGTGDFSLAKIREAPTLADFPLWHTSYGALGRIDKDLKREGYQGWGGHSGGSLLEFSDDEGDVQRECPQFYLMLPDGEHGDFEQQLDTLLDDYPRSIGAAREQGRIHPSIPITGYWQAYNTRTDALCIATEYFEYNQYWTGTRRYTDDAGSITIACMSELFRQKKTILQFQMENGLYLVGPNGKPLLGPDGKPFYDRRFGPKTYKAMFPSGQWIHPQDKTGKSPKDQS